jgi:hypothetical protein
LPAAFVLVSGIDQVSRTLGKANLAAVIQGLEADAGRLAVLGSAIACSTGGRRLLGD